MELKQSQLWTKVVLINFFIAALIGVLMRLAFVFELSFINYRNVLHAHSHIAMMGWLFGALYVLIVLRFGQYRRIYAQLFWLFQICIAGMLISFPIQGYGIFSIIFTTGHMLLSYVFVFQIWKDLKQKKGPAIRFLKTALLFLLLSTLATWALGPLMQSGLNRSSWYYSTVQFFLHFQFNGWFIFAIIALFFKFLEHSQIPISLRASNRFYWLLVISCFLTYTLAVTWSTPDKFLFWANSLGVIIQLVALFVVVQPVRKAIPHLRRIISKKTLALWIFALLCFVIKISLQAFVAIPFIAKISYTVHNFVIGFIHLLMLGMLSTFILGSFHVFNLRRSTSVIRSRAITLFITGILLSEVLLFAQGIMFWIGWGFMPGYYVLLTIASACMPIGIGLYTFSSNKAT